MHIDASSEPTKVPAIIACPCDTASKPSSIRRIHNHRSAAQPRTRGRAGIAIHWPHRTLQVPLSLRRLAAEPSRYMVHVFRLPYFTSVSGDAWDRDVHEPPRRQRSRPRSHGSRRSTETCGRQHDGIQTQAGRAQGSSKRGKRCCRARLRIALQAREH